jgi:hypothetical protein
LGSISDATSDGSPVVKIGRLGAAHGLMDALSKVRACGAVKGACRAPIPAILIIQKITPQITPTSTDTMSLVGASVLNKRLQQFRSVPGAEPTPQRSQLSNCTLTKVGYSYRGGLSFFQRIYREHLLLFIVSNYY